MRKQFIRGTRQDDVIFGTSRDDVIVGKDGDDTLFGDQRGGPEFSASLPPG